MADLRMTTARHPGACAAPPAVVSWRCDIHMDVCLIASVEATHLHGGRNEGGHEQGALRCREVLCQLELPLGDLHIVVDSLLQAGDPGKAVKHS